MKKSNKGFTLIELLAVIVILAVIALIATPLIMNVINDARKNSSKDAAYGYIDAVEKSIVQALYSNPEMSMPATVGSDVSVKGSKPTAASLTLSEGTVVGGTITINSHTWVVTGASGSLSESK